MKCPVSYLILQAEEEDIVIPTLSMKVRLTKRQAIAIQFQYRVLGEVYRWRLLVPLKSDLEQH